jgi:hypothetical protein
MRAILSFIIAIAGLVLLPGMSMAQVFDQVFDLTGMWHTQTGATFYVRQIGTEIWWYGSEGSRWTNVAGGRVDGDVIRIRWVDVPLGVARSAGTLGLRVVAGNHLVVIENPNGFVPADWFR